MYAARHIHVATVVTDSFSIMEQANFEHKPFNIHQLPSLDEGPETGIMKLLNLQVSTDRHFDWSPVPFRPIKLSVSA